MRDNRSMVRWNNRKQNEDEEAFRRRAMLHAFLIGMPLRLKEESSFS